MNDNYIRLLIADDHNLFRDGIKSMLSTSPDILIVGEVSNGKDLIKSYFDIMPDVILLDISMPELSGVEALKKIKKDDKEAKALFLSMHDDEEYIYYCLSAGGLGLAPKSIALGELIFAIKKVAAGEQYFGKKWNQEKLLDLERKFKVIEKKYSKENMAFLTPTEEKVLLLIGDGLTSSQISKKLNIGKRTIDYHRMQIMSKFNLKSLPELIKFSIQYETSVKKSGK